MIDHTQVKLGKHPPRHDVRTLKLSSYLMPGELPPVPDSQDWGKAVPQWPMYGNDRIGDCGLAGPGHAIQVFHFNAGRPWTPPEADIIKAYSDVSGYDPKTGKNDNGVNLLDVMNYWRKVGIAQNFIGAFVKVNPGDIREVKTALYLFGGLIAGIALPLTAKNQEVWDVVGMGGNATPNSWGGHCVLFSKYAPWGAVTWGYVQPFTEAFMTHYCDELYAVAAKGWVMDTGKAPSGVAWRDLLADLQRVTA